MTDDADRADIYIEQMLSAALRKISPTTEYNFGECDFCGEEGRLIDGLCIPCIRIQEAKEKNWRV